jgi:methylase of polypeptide subunit release factors
MVPGEAGDSQAADTSAGMQSKEMSQALTLLGRALRDTGYRFTTVTPATHARVNALAEAGGNAWARGVEDVFGWSRPFRADAVPSDIFALMHAAGIVQPFRDGWRSMLRASTLGPHLYFHSAFPTDAADSVFFGPDTYRFARALDAELPALTAGVQRAIDIGCGTGAGALRIAAACPAAEIIAADINDAALHLCTVNAGLAEMPAIRTANSNLLQHVDGSFDLIVSNPPYLLDRARRSYRDGGGDLGRGLSLAIVDAAMQRLSPGGTLLLYTGVAITGGEDLFLREAGARLRACGYTWSYEELDPDVFGEELDEPAYAGVDRIAAVWLKASRPGDAASAQP